mgnify:CR=1 FL=1
MVANAFCSKCGSELPTGQVFCTSCGAILNNEVESATNKGRNVGLFVLFAILKWISLGLGILLVVGITSAAESTMQETTAALYGCLCAIIAVFFHLEQHKS